MEREIKFRGKRTDNKEWVCGDLVTGLNNEYYIRHVVEYGKSKCAEITMVDKETVGQFTGFTDSENNEIFGGNLINSYQNDFMPTEVYWDDDLGQWATTNYHSTLSLCDSMQKDIKVLGNTYDNPELLTNSN